MRFNARAEAKALAVPNLTVGELTRALGLGRGSGITIWPRSAGRFGQPQPKRSWTFRRMR